MTVRAAAPLTLLLTRPAPDAARFADQIRAHLGAVPALQIVIAPLMQIVARPVALPAAQALIFTSHNAIAPYVAQAPAAGRRAYCVGMRTAQAARAAGFDVVEGPGDAAALLALIRRNHRGGRLLHPRGAEVAVPVADLLNQAGIETVEVVIYDQAPMPLSPEAQALLQGSGPVIVPLFSPRSARLFAQAAATATASLWIAALSPAVAAGLGTLPVAQLAIASAPNATALLQAVAQLIGAPKAG